MATSLTISLSHLWDKPLREGRRSQCPKEPTERSGGVCCHGNPGREGRWKVVSLLSAAEGSEVKEYGDQEEAIGFR